MRAPLWCAVLALLALQGAAILFDLSPAAPNMCLGDEYYEGHIITVKYNVPDDTDSWDTTITLHGPTPGSRVLHTVPNVDNNPGEFSFEVHDDGYYKVCLTAQAVGQYGANSRGRNRRMRQGDILRGNGVAGVSTRRVEVKLSEAAAEEDEFYKQQQEYEKQANEAAKVQNVPGKEDLLSPHDLQPVNILLIRTESQLEKLKSEFREFRARESEHRNTNESTNSRTVSFSMLTIIALVILALWQGFYMRNYFKKKKLI